MAAMDLLFVFSALTNGPLNVFDCGARFEHCRPVALSLRSDFPAQQSLVELRDGIHLAGRTITATQYLLPQGHPQSFDGLNHGQHASLYASQRVKPIVSGRYDLIKAIDFLLVGIFRLVQSFLTLLTDEICLTLHSTNPLPTGCNLFPASPSSSLRHAQLWP